MAALFFVPCLPRSSRARVHIYAHTNDIIDIYLLYYIYRKQECNYRKAEKGKERKAKERKEKERKEKERDGRMEGWKDK